MAKVLPSLRSGVGAEGPETTNGAAGYALLKHEKKGLPHFYSEEAHFASRRLKTLVSVPPEKSLEQQGLLIDTDPRKVGNVPLEELELPGVTGGHGRPSSSQGKKKKETGKGKKKEATEQPVVSYATDAQLAAEEAAMQDKILYEMRQNLQKLKEYGKEIGFSFDISKKKSQWGRMQGEKWEDEELGVWKKQASRMIATPEPEDKKTMREAPQLEKMGHYVFHMERMLNEIKFFRQKKQQQMADLQNEFDVAEEQESREQSGAGKMADMFGRVSKTRERIQNTEQNILAESEICKELSKEHDEELAAVQELRDLIEETSKSHKQYDHDLDILKKQLKASMHDVEKCLQQGKLVTMLEVKGEIKSRYKSELEMRTKVIEKQKEIKEELAAHAKRVAELTVKLQQQYDPTLDSPRRNELKRKAEAFEQVFETMMKRIGESDITRIVEMFQKQTHTFQAWTEAVRDQEIRVKALQDEKKTLEKQLHKVSSNQQYGVANETRQYTISGRRLDMATERLDNSTMRLMQLEGLMAHVKESMREALLRLNDYSADVQVPPAVFPNDGEGGLIEVVRNFADSIVALQPQEEKYAQLMETVRTFEAYSEPPSKPTSPISKQDAEDRPFVATMPKALKQAIHRAGEDLEMSNHGTEEEFFSEGNLNRRIPFPKSREQQKEQQKHEEEQDKTDALADMRDIITREEVKRNAYKIQKAKEREKLEAEARDRGEDISPGKKKKKPKTPAPSSPT